MGSTSLIVAKRKQVSNRATVKGTPIKITTLTGGCNGPMLTFTNTIRESTEGYGRRNVSTFFPVLHNIIALRRTVGGRGTGEGLTSATRRICEAFAVL